MTPDLTESDVLLQSRALLNLIEISEQARKDKAQTLVRIGGVYWHGQEGDTIVGGVKASKGEPYLVKVHLRKMKSGNWVIAGTECECWDGKHSSCKHSLALAAARLLTLREEWRERKLSKKAG